MSALIAMRFEAEVPPKTKKQRSLPYTLAARASASPETPS